MTPRETSCWTRKTFSWRTRRRYRRQNLLKSTTFIRIRRQLHVTTTLNQVFPLGHTYESIRNVLYLPRKSRRAGRYVRKVYYQVEVQSEIYENVMEVLGTITVNENLLTVPKTRTHKTKNSTTRKKLASTACAKRTLCSQSMTTPGLPSKERGCTYPLFCVRPERSESPSCAAAKLHANPVGNTQRFALVGLCAPRIGFAVSVG